MKLPVKAYVFVLLIVVSSVIITYLGSQVFIKKSFENIESSRSKLNVERVVNALDAEIDAQDVLTGDWANWDNAYEFAKNKNKDFISANFADVTFENAGVNFIAFYDTTGDIIHSRFFDLNNNKEIGVPKDLGDQLIVGKLLLGEVTESKHGMVKTNEGPLMVTAHPILQSTGKGSSRGTIVMAKYLDQKIIDEISETTKLKVELMDYKKDLFTNGRDVILVPQNADTIFGYGRLRDIYGNPAYTFKVEMDREITREGSKSTLYFVYYLMTVGFLGMVAANAFLKNLVLNPISGLVSDLGKIAESGNFAGRVNIKSEDEIGILAKDINMTLEALAKAQNDLSRSQRTLSTLMSNLPGMAYRCLNDKDWTMKFASRGSLLLTGYKPDEITDNKTASYGSLIHPDDRKMVWDEVQKAIAQSRPFLLVYRILTKDKEIKWVWEQGREVGDAGGERFLEGFINDITPQKTAELELIKQKAGVEKLVEERTKELNDAKEKISEGWLQIQREKAKLISSINSLALGFVITDNSGQVILTNPAVDKILGVAQSKWSLESIQKILGPEYDLKAEIELCMKDPLKCIPKTLQLGNKFVKIIICPISAPEDGEKKAFGAVVVFEDTTQARSLERSRDEFFSIASHELRTPLTAIRGNISLIEEHFGEKVKSREIKEMLHDVYESAIRLIGIVNDFLNMSRLEMGKIAFKKIAIDPAGVAEEVVGELSLEASAKKLKLEITPPQKPLNVWADKDKLKEVLINLIGNALKYTDKGGVNVSFVSEGGFVKISVADTGRGIAPENQELLFHKFQQAGDSIFTRDATKGTGLGLYISKLMIQSMGGKIWLESSQEGKGSVFIISLPEVS